MMHKKNETRWKGVKLIFFVPILLFLVQAFARPEIFNNGISQNPSDQKHQSSSFLNNEKYDVIIYKDRLEVLNENCSFNELNEKIEKILQQNRDKKDISILTLDDVSPERLKMIKFEINNIPDIRISTTIVKLEDPNVEYHPQRLFLKENGDIYLNDQKYSLPEFEHQIEQLAESSLNKGITGVIFEIDNNATYMQVETVKQILRKWNIKQLKYEIQQHSVSETTPFADNSQPVNVAGISLNGPLKEKQLNRIMASARSYLKKPNTIEAIIFTNKDTPTKDIEILKGELMKAGYKKVTIKVKT